MPELPAAISTTHRGGGGDPTAKGESDRDREARSKEEEGKEEGNRKRRE